MLTPQIYLLNKGPLSTKLILFSTNHTHCIAGLQPHKLVPEVGGCWMETNGRYSKSGLLNEYEF